MAVIYATSPALKIAIKKADLFVKTILILQLWYWQAGR